MRGLVIHAVLAAAGLLFAYQTWTRPAVTEEPLAASEPPLFDCTPDELEWLELELLTHSLRIDPVKGGKAPVYWLTSTPPASKAAEPVAPADAGVDKPDMAGIRAASAKEPVTFRGNTMVEALLAAILPLRPLRDLGKLEASRDAEFGFDKASTTLRVKCGGDTLTLTLAGRTYGNNDSYARDQKTGKTYLLLGKPFVDLQSAQSKLMQTDLHTFKLADVDEAVIKAGGATKKLVQRDRAIKGLAQWVDADKPDQRNEAFGNWFGRIGRMRVRKFLPRGAAPGDELTEPHGAPQPVMEIEYKLEGEPTGKLEVVRIDVEEGTRDERRYYGRSETTEVWVTLFEALLKEIETDLPLVVGEGANSSTTPVAPPRAPPK